MSVGVFLGIGSSSGDADEVAKVRQAVSAALTAAGLPDYVETDDLAAAGARYDELAAQARTTEHAIDAASLKVLARTIMRARGTQAGPFTDFATRPEQLFVPGDFTQRVDAPQLASRCVWSTGALHTALRLAALTLGLPLANNDVPPNVIKLVAAHKKLGKNDPANDDPDDYGFSMVSHYRPEWLTLWELTRIAHEHKLALVLAG
jgi:hypothetical protein